MRGKRVLRQGVLVVLAVCAVLLLAPSPRAEAWECPTCYDDCSWWLLMTLCVEAPQGLVGYCHCKERPCVVSGEFCTVINVTP
jgi:hypothetical protein